MGFSRLRTEGSSRNSEGRPGAPWPRGRANNPPSGVRAVGSRACRSGGQWPVDTGTQVTSGSEDGPPGGQPAPGRAGEPAEPGRLCAPAPGQRSGWPLPGGVAATEAQGAGPPAADAGSLSASQKAAKRQPSETPKAIKHMLGSVSGSQGPPVWPVLEAWHPRGAQADTLPPQPLGRGHALGN